MEVQLLRWPEEESLRSRLAAERQPRLLLVTGDADLPLPDADCLEDWVRLPAGEGDVQARVAGLEHRAALHGGNGGVRPSLDEHGVLRVGDRWVSLPPVEARLVGAMLARLGAVVRRDALVRAGWPDGSPGRNVLDVHMARLRRRLSPSGVVVRTVRSRGYLLELLAAPAPPPPPREPSLASR
jgi:hypothetical protein